MIPRYEEIRFVLQGMVKLKFLPLQPDIQYIKLNAKQCCIYQTYLNDDIEVPFEYTDPLLDVHPEEHE